MVKIMGWNTCLYVYEDTGLFVITCSHTYTLILAMKIDKPIFAKHIFTNIKICIKIE